MMPQGAVAQLYAYLSGTLNSPPRDLALCDAVEVHPVALVDPTDSSAGYEQCDDNPRQAVMWSVYVHFDAALADAGKHMRGRWRQVGVDCFADFDCAGERHAGEARTLALAFAMLLDAARKEVRRAAGRPEGVQ